MKRIGRLVFAVAIMGPSALAAQGAKETSARAWVVEPAPAPPAEPLVSHAQPARGILATLVGTWRFEIRFAGNYGGAPDAAGTRVMHALFDDLRVEWTEALDHSPLAGQGIVGFDPANDRFFWTAVYSAGAAPELLTGVLDDAQPTIAFRPVAGDPDRRGRRSFHLGRARPRLARGLHPSAIVRRRGLASRGPGLHARGAGGDPRLTSSTLPQRGFPVRQRGADSRIGIEQTFASPRCVAAGGRGCRGLTKGA